MLKLPSLSDLDQSPGVRIFLCTCPTDMRRGFDTLAQMARSICEQDPLSGHLFLFRSRSGGRLKLLVWEGDGFVLWYKRLEEGTFRFPKVHEGQEKLEIKPSELAMLLSGIDLRSVKKLPRYGRKLST
jgi:transposase